ncbi:ATP-binding cassette domain-containing protein [Catenulispora pinisilvae]|uniref:ATP-binding cassette domain-containing protein n=1 Tax=Catenulispora pinisilvae TaxID=2705253 RepID=UPI002B2650B9|nr:ATP-binding cassette domain-containing protein [Catenulispora pinisilvae]
MTETTTSATPRTAGSGEPILKLRAINKSFGPVHVLQDVDFEAHAGEVTALVGDNGAGKSTLVKCIGGTYSIDGGDYLFEGAPVKVHDPRDAASLGIEIVYQDLALCENLDIVGNMFLGRERVSGWRTLDENTMERMAGETLSGLSVRTVKSLRQQVSSLSGGQRQTVAIAKSVLWNSKVVILDEPTAALGVAQTAQVLDLVRRLADRGLAVILISHNMRDVLEVADRIVALYLGKTAAQVQRADVTQTQIVELITAGHSGNIGLLPTANGNGNGNGNAAQVAEVLGIADGIADEPAAVADAAADAEAAAGTEETDGTDGVQGAAE